MNTGTAPSAELAQYTLRTAEAASAASRSMATVNGDAKSGFLKALAEGLRGSAESIIAENQRDLEAARSDGLSSAMVDRLRLTPDRISSLADAVQEIDLLPDPVGEMIDSTRRPNGLQVSKVRVPLGVVFFIYESRPNVTVDAAALCVKSGNAVILRGGKEAQFSNAALYQVIRSALETAGLPPDAVQLVSTTDRAAVGEFLRLGRLIDVTIPRGGRQLIERVTAEATMPVIKHFDGICHLYLDESADLQQAVDITVNSKCSRPGVCNAAETLLVHAAAADRLLPAVAKALAENGCELRCCPISLPLVENGRPAEDEDFGREFLDLIMAIRVVPDADAAIEHIARFGSGHTDAIVTSNWNAGMHFQQHVDSSAVVINASTRFNDGGEFGLGAEIGISTDRFHARGPCGLREITTYKYVVHGTGQIR